MFFCEIHRCELSENACLLRQTMNKCNCEQGLEIAGRPAIGKGNPTPNPSPQAGRGIKVRAKRAAPPKIKTRQEGKMAETKCRNHPDRPAVIDRKKGETDLCKGCLIARGKGATVKKGKEKKEAELKPTKNQRRKKEKLNPDTVVLVDFKDHLNLRDKINILAKKDFRTPEGEILCLIDLVLNPKPATPAEV